MKNTIRKIWVGSDIKDKSMSWEVDQWVRISKNPSDEKGKINHITESGETPGTYTVWVKKGGSIVPWKTTSMDVTVEYDLTF